MALITEFQLIWIHPCEDFKYWSHGYCLLGGLNERFFKKLVKINSSAKNKNFFAENGVIFAQKNTFNGFFLRKGGYPLPPLRTVGSRKVNGKGGLLPTSRTISVTPIVEVFP